VIPRPWTMSTSEIASAEEAIRSLVGLDVAHLLRPVLSHEHAPLVDLVHQLPWDDEPAEAVADHALHALRGATMPGGLLDPAHDDADVPWVRMLLMVQGSGIASRSARRWFAHLERLLWEGAVVSTIPMAVAAYAVARFEDDLEHPTETWWWMQMAASQGELDDRQGIGLVVLIRAAHLLAGRSS
jgi:hypothetical protein